MSRPCINCVRRLTNLPQYSGYRISNVFYTEGDTKVRLNHLASQPTQHIPCFQTYNGVSQINGRWRAKPNYEGKSHHLGYFPTSREQMLFESFWNNKITLTCVTIIVTVTVVKMKMTRSLMMKRSISSLDIKSTYSGSKK